MSFIGDIFGGGDTAEDAANAQTRSNDKSIAAQKEALATARADLAPYRNAGASTITGLQSLITDPNAQKSYIQNNPFYQSLAQDATDKLYANSAAKGKLGSGGTLKALQNSLLLLGSDLLNQNITQRQNLVNTGESAAAGSGTASQATANNLTSLYTNQGNIDAANSNAQNNSTLNGISNLANLGASIYSLSDIRFKHDVERVGSLSNGLPVYRFKYNGDDEERIGVMAQDVERVIPEAVIEQNGVKYVNLEAACSRI